MENLSGLVLDGIHLHEVRGVLALSSLDCFEQAVVAVAGNGLPCHLRAEELHHLLLQDSAAGEEPGGQPEQLPASLLACPQSVVC